MYKNLMLRMSLGRKLDRARPTLSLDAGNVLVAVEEVISLLAVLDVRVQQEGVPITTKNQQSTPTSLACLLRASSSI